MVWYGTGLLTLKEGRLLVGVHVDLSEFSNADLFGVGPLNAWLLIEAITVCAQSPRLELIVSKGDTDWPGEHLICTLG